MNNLVDELMKEIAKAEQEAIKQGIETNTVILNENFDKCRDFYTSLSAQGVRYIPPMILGKYIFIGDLPEKYTFALFKSNYESELDEYKRKCEQLEAQLNEIKEILK